MPYSPRATGTPGRGRGRRVPARGDGVARLPGRDGADPRAGGRPDQRPARGRGDPAREHEARRAPGLHGPLRHGRRLRRRDARGRLRQRRRDDDDPRAGEVVRAARPPTARSSSSSTTARRRALLASQRARAAWQETGKAVRAVLRLRHDRHRLAGRDAGRSQLPVHVARRRGRRTWTPLLRHVNYDVLGFPEAENLVHIVGVNERNSDESSWDGAGLPLAALGRHARRVATTPPTTCPTTTMATIERVAGGRTFFEQGLRNTLLSCVPDRDGARQRDAGRRADGDGTRPGHVRRRRARAIPTARPSAYEWDFGDGTTGSGLTATHTYARGGDYVATLTVRGQPAPRGDRDGDGAGARRRPAARRRRPRSAARRRPKKARREVPAR